MKEHRQHTNGDDSDGDRVEQRAEEDARPEREQMLEDGGRRERRLQLLGQEGAHDEALERGVRDHRDGQQVAQRTQERARLTHQHAVHTRVHQPLRPLVVQVRVRQGRRGARDADAGELVSRALGSTATTTAAASAEHGDEFGGYREQRERAGDEAGDEQRAEREPVARLELVHAHQSGERERLERSAQERECGQHAETHHTGGGRPPVREPGPLPLGGDGGGCAAAFRSGHLRGIQRERRQMELSYC